MDKPSDLTRWHLVAAQEYTISQHDLSLLPDKQNKEDVLRPLAISFSLEGEKKNIFNVRFHQKNDMLFAGVDNCVLEGFRVDVAWHYRRAKPQVLQELSTGSSILNIPAPFEILKYINLCTFVTKPTESFDFHSVNESSLTYRRLLGKSVNCVEGRLCSAVFRLKIYRPIHYLSPDSLVLSLNKGREEGHMCDVVLVVDGKDFPAHKCVLAASSDVFRTMFTADFKEKDAARVEIQDVSKEAFTKFLDFIYLGALKDGWEGKEIELLELADKYEVHVLKSECMLRLWEAEGEDALRLLLDSAKSPVIPDELRDRLCSQVACSWDVVKESPHWNALEESSYYTAVLIRGMAVAEKMTPASSILALQERHDSTTRP